MIPVKEAAHAFLDHHRIAVTGVSRAGTSHGCVGLADVEGAQGDTPAKWFYDNSLIGDVVIVKNSPDKTVAPANGLNGWNMGWSEWIAGSAV